VTVGRFRQLEEVCDSFFSLSIIQNSASFLLVCCERVTLDGVIFFSEVDDFDDRN